MCGRYTLQTAIKILQEIFGLDEITLRLMPRYNIAPSQDVVGITNLAPKTLRTFRWGLVPSWAKDPAIGNKMINARCETLAEKPSYRDPAKKRRCLILADGFYEWKKVEKGKQPVYIRLKSKRPFAFAGLWDTWRSPDGKEIVSCTIITTRANRLMEALHDRMPVIVPEKQWTMWLDPKPVDPKSFAPLFEPYPPDPMELFPVSKLVNAPANDRPECIAPEAS